MVKGRPLRKTLNSYPVQWINKIIRPGDCVLMVPAKSSNLSDVARIERIISDSKKANVKVYVRWYYRPEELLEGRRQFHGSKEIILSDRYDYRSTDRIEGICTVRNFKRFTIHDAVENDDFFCRFEYNSSTGAFRPDKVPVYCNCQMPYNPDDIMVHCEGCDNWFHPKCLEMDIEEAQKIHHFFCEVCTSEKQKFLQNSHGTSTPSDTKRAFMAKGRPPRKTLDSYLVKGINKIIRPGDCVLMTLTKSSNLPHVARIEKIVSDSKEVNIRVYVRWYYRPEESLGGRRQFHGSKEIFLSDHYNYQNAARIEGICTVRNFKNFTILDAVGNDDFFCRFKYNSSTGALSPDKVVVYCSCEMPYNPDDIMVHCESCDDWFHPECIEMDIEEAQKIKHFFCEVCTSGKQKFL